MAIGSSYMQRTQTAGNQKTWTVSMWVKRGDVETQQCLMSVEDGAAYVLFKFNASEYFEWRGETGAARFITTRVFRDPGAWYHIVVACDTTESVEADRFKIYINGVQETDFGTETYPALNSDTYVNKSGGYLRVGSDEVPGSYLNGCMSWVQLVDGAALAPTEFGSVDATSGIWKIKPGAYATPGTNGFCLAMEDRTNLDLDTSSNAHTFTTTGTPTATYDNPSNNFCTLNPIQMSDPSANYVLSQGNNTLTVTSNDFMRQVGLTINPLGLKGYFEFKCVADSNYQVQFQDATVKLYKKNYESLASGGMYFLTWGDLNFSNGGSSGTLTSAYFASPGAAEGDIMGCAFDFSGSNRDVWFHRNGTYGNNGSGVGVPSTGAYPAFSASLLLLTTDWEIIFASNSGTTCTTAFNFGNGYFGTTAISSAGTNASGIGEFEYDVPTGFTALSTKGLNV